MSVGRDTAFAQMREQIDTLMESNRQLKDALAPTISLAPLGLARGEGCIVAALWKAAPNVATKERLMIAVYGLRSDVPDEKIIDVLICKARRRLAHFDIRIETHWGLGYRMDLANAERLGEALRRGAEGDYEDAPLQRPGSNGGPSSSLVRAVKAYASIGRGGRMDSLRDGRKQRHGPIHSGGNGLTILNINLVDKTIIGPIEITSVESARVAIDAIKGAVGILWKGAFETEAASMPVVANDLPRKERRKRKTPSGEPKEGTYDARVQEAVRRLGSSDRIVIAEDLIEPPIKISLALGRLKERGCLP